MAALPGAATEAVRNLAAKTNLLDALGRATKSKSLAEGKRLHSQVVEQGLNHDPELQNQLVQMYSACGSLEDARKLFDAVACPKVLSWNMLIAAYGNAGRIPEARRLFERMPGKTSASWTTMVTMYAKSGHKEEAKSMFDSTREPSTIAWNAMISLYAHTGQLQEARSMFHRMPEPSVASYNVMISALGYNGCVSEAKSLFDSMKDRTVVSWNAMVTAFAQNARVDEAEKLFREMPDKSVISWNAMIAGFGQNGRPKQALELFRRMDLEGLQPSRMTYCSVLDACANLTASSLGRFICDGMDEALAKDISVANSICNMYGKCGLPELARQTFLEMTYRDVVSWTAIIAAYSQNGYSSEALDIFRIMVQAGVEPNGITLINTLSACSHGALFDEGSDIFSSLVSGDYYGVTANESHFLCAIDLLGRAGYLKDAETLITKMPFKAGAVAWTSLLSACRTFRDLKRAGRVANHLFELDESSIKDPAPYVMLSNIYASAGDRAAEMKLRDQIRIKCRKKLPGKSTITIKGQTNEFYSLDETHPRRDDAYNELRRLFQKMKEAGYVPDTRIAEMEEEETEQSLSYHSEKLALAFGVLNTPPEASLCIVKNLRVCSDCHNVIKFLSKHLNRKIAVRDATRFHHFENGFCSCRDCW
ncbi:pentatricopeptide repeat-containing protein At4g02750 [Selaginella moellendorffii]|uniref:pentatricopeptide repeat-containing protein At4g02750 n=1 Tax=Selaginella moellendorffii TaxID=88036 RepID=UPI000D1C44AD|nr:pentatricopeptide repeat-containing protein At4g02750 [Selaginella moellendorffii]|eukprot:XP_024533694.1 pentatricopeptide repeat-containing protein At4g02750 [Selaginella moellendorffii]